MEATITYTREELRLMGEILSASIDNTNNFMKEEDDEEIIEICKDELRIINSIMKKGKEKCWWLKD